jgi:hypothetical protein
VQLQQLGLPEGAVLTAATVVLPQGAVLTAEPLAKAGEATPEDQVVLRHAALQLPASAGSGASATTGSKGTPQHRDHLMWCHTPQQMVANKVSCALDLWATALV